MKNDSLFQAFLVASAFAAIGCGSNGQPVSPATALATGQTLITSIAVDGSFVYWTTADGHVRRVSTEGGPVTDVVTNLSTPQHLAVDDEQVFWASGDGVIASAPKAGGAAVTLAMNETVNGLALDTSHLYWTAQTGDVKRLVKTGGSAEMLAVSQSNPNDIAVNVSGVFWANGGGASATGSIVGLPATNGDMVAGTPTVTLAPGQTSPTHLAADPDNVFWSSVSTDNPDPTATTSTNGVVSRVSVDASSMSPLVPATSDDVSILASGQAFIRSISGDANNAYWTADDGTVSAASINGGCTGTCPTAPDAPQIDAPSVLVEGPTGQVLMTTDDVSIYWANLNEGAILMMPKPQSN